MLCLSPLHNEKRKKHYRNGGFGTFLRAFYAALERRRSINPAVAAVAFGGSDDEWASLQVCTCSDARAQSVAFAPSHILFIVN